MSYIIDRSREIMRQGGFTRLAARFCCYEAKLFYLLWCALVRRYPGPKTGPEGLVDFVRTGCRGLIAPIQDSREITSLVALIDGLRPKRVIEIGTALGGTLFLWTRISAPDATLVTIDLPGGKFGEGYPAWKIPLFRSFALPGQRMHLIRADSHDPATCGKVEKFLDKAPVDLLFIDGDHTYEGVRKDFELYAPLVRKGGLIVLHDIVRHLPETGCDVYTFWQEVKARHRHVEMITDKDQTDFGIGVLFVD